MQTKLLKTEDYLLLVEDIHHPDLNIYDWYVCKDLSAIAKITNITRANYEGISTKNVNLSFLHYQANTVYKILAHLPLNNTPILEGVNLLPDPFENTLNIEHLAEEQADEECFIDNSLNWTGFYKGFIAGYKAAQSKQ